MAHYLVKAKPRKDRLQELKRWLNSGEIAQMDPFGETLQHSLEQARLDSEGYAIWEEEDYCHPPLAQERAAVLNRYFADLSVTSLEEGDGWNSGAAEEHAYGAF